MLDIPREAHGAGRASRQVVARSERSQQTFRPDIQGLRAIAVLMVICTHAGVPWITGGHAGVDVFFVISGFVISGMLLREHARTGSISLLRFYARRVRRILPAATFVLVVTLAAAAAVLTARQTAAIATDGAWTSVFLANLRFAQGVAAPLRDGDPLAHYWSLAVEEQFYLVWPALALLALGAMTPRRLLAALGAVIVASLGLALLLGPEHPHVAYYAPVTRGWEFGLGAAVAVCSSRLVAIRPALRLATGGLGLAAILGTAVAFPEGTSFTGLPALVPAIGTTCVIAAGTGRRRTVANALLEHPVLRWLGDRSYSLYLWHWPLLAIAALRLGGYPPLRGIVLLGIAVVLADLTFRYVEDPMRRSERFTRSPRRSLTFGAALVAGAVVISVATPALPS